MKDFTSYVIFLPEKESPAKLLGCKADMAHSPRVCLVGFICSSGVAGLYPELVPQGEAGYLLVTVSVRCDQKVGIS